MIRTLAGVAVGIAVAIILMMIVEALGNALFPPPPIDLGDSRRRAGPNAG